MAMTPANSLSRWVVCKLFNMDDVLGKRRVSDVTRTNQRLGTAATTDAAVVAGFSLLRQSAQSAARALFGMAAPTPRPALIIAIRR